MIQKTFISSLGHKNVRQRRVVRVREAQRNSQIMSHVGGPRNSAHPTCSNNEKKTTE